MAKGKYRAEKKPSEKRLSGITVLLFILMLLGLAMMFLPSLTSQDDQQKLKNQVNTFKELVASYSTVPQISSPTEPESTDSTAISVHPELFQAMLQYNIEIYENGQEGLQNSDDFEETLIDPADYGIEDGIIGVVSIPKIEVELPLYLGGSYDNLANGFAQLGYTSMPTGGENTNCVIAGHRGWRGMAYMRDVEELNYGDPIYVQTLWETLEYRVSEIYLIEPYELDHIYIQPDRDLLTIVTCHPYGVGSHRYILICDRYEPEDAPVIEETTTPTEEPEVLLQWKWEDRVNITTGEGTTFRSSNIVIFMTEYVPWICLGLAILISAVYLLGGKKKK